VLEINRLQQRKLTRHESDLKLNTRHLRNVSTDSLFANRAIPAHLSDRDIRERNIGQRNIWERDIRERDTREPIAPC
jgi:hypothetical protein